MFNRKITYCRWSLWLAFFALMCINLYAEQSTMDNISMIEKNCTSATADIKAKLSQSKAKISKIQLNEHSSAAYFYNLIFSDLSSSSLIDEQSGKALNITIIDNNIKYNQISSKGKVERIADIKLSYSLNEESFAYSTSIKDTIDAEDIPWSERGEFPFAKSPLKEDKSWYDKYIAPAVVFTSSVLAVVLLFTVRSK